jgi:hypothetical protein
MRNPFILLKYCKLSVLPCDRGKSSFCAVKLWWVLAWQPLLVSRNFRLHAGPQTGR